MPPGRPKSDKEPTDVPDDTNTPEAPPTDETSEKADPRCRVPRGGRVPRWFRPRRPPSPPWFRPRQPKFRRGRISTSPLRPPESAEDSTDEPEPVRVKRKTDWSRVLAYGVLPGLALLLALAAGFFRWEYVSSDYGALPPAASEQDPSPAFESMNAAKDSTIKMLSYKPESVDQQLNSARDLLTGEFRDSYTTLINDVVIPGAKQKQISAVASVPAIASVSADPKHAVVLVFVNQTVVVGQDPPSDTASSVRVTLEKVDDRWLISEFEPV